MDDRHIETAYGSKVEDRCLTRESPFSEKLQYRSGVVTCYQRTGNYYRGTAIESALSEPLWFTFAFEILPIRD